VTRVGGADAGESSATLTTAEQLALVRLRLSNAGFGAERWRRLRDVFGGAAAALEAPARAWQAARVPRQLLRAASAVTESELASVVSALARARTRVVAWNDNNYPTLLSHIIDAPPLLFVRGQLSSALPVPVAIVGSRAATPVGKKIALEFAESLVGYGCTVVSGLAYGIDAAAHRGALLASAPLDTAQQPQIAVAACGPDQVYPRAHRGLAREIVASGGAIITEFLPGEPPLPTHFPRRNRIISGMCLGVVVVEAAGRSGSLITARLAGEQGRGVFAVPGSILSPQSVGCHQLLRDGATLIEDVREVIAELLPQLSFHIDNPKATDHVPTKGAAADKRPVCEGLSESERKVHEALRASALSVDDVANSVAKDLPETLAVLQKLAIRGVVCMSPGGLWSVC
jgi:DNA processing protein